MKEFSMTTTSTAPKERPVKTFAAGGVRAAIWENHIQDPNTNQTVLLHNTKITRSYKDDKDGTWHEVSHFRAQDLPKLILVAQEAFKYVSLKPEAGQEDLPV